MALMAILLVQPPAKPQGLSCLPERPFEPLRIDGSEIAAFHQASPLDRIAIPHLGHEVDVGHLANRVEERPAHERHADPLGIGRFRQHENARFHLVGSNLRLHLRLC
jgi:hypothetical protein